MTKKESKLIKSLRKALPGVKHLRLSLIEMRDSSVILFITLGSLGKRLLPSHQDLVSVKTALKGLPARGFEYNYSIIMPPIVKHRVVAGVDVFVLGSRRFGLVPGMEDIQNFRNRLLAAKIESPTLVVSCCNGLAEIKKALRRG